MNDNRRTLETRQLEQLRALVAELVPDNRFWTPRLRRAGLEDGVESLEQFSRALPPVRKHELVDDQKLHAPWGSNLTYPLDRYVRFHQTSGTTGRPLRWLDTAESWQATLDTWCRVFEIAEVGSADRIFFPFSFGPFLGFWTAFDAVQRLGTMAIPGGGMNSRARLEVLLSSQATAMCCTPTYALRLAEVATEEGIDLAASRVRALFVAGEPGGSVPAVRERLSRAWNGATVFDQHGMTEVGPVSYPNADFPELLHLDEESFYAEVVDPESSEPLPVGEEGELLLTTLRRTGSPLLRYRTGDLVRFSSRTAEETGQPHRALDGGILARVDDMVVVRGVNLYPSAIDRVVRGHEDVVEYRVVLDRRGAMVEAVLEVEVADHDGAESLSRRLEESLRTAFQLRIPVRRVAADHLPRFELKAKRWVEKSEALAGTIAERRT